MRSLRPLAVLVLLLAAACMQPHASDPHAIGPTLDRWQATVPGAPAAVFDNALRVLTDSGFPIADARKDAGLIKSGYRDASSVERGGKQLRMMLLGGDLPHRVSLVLLPSGADSTRVTITGDYYNKGAPEVVIPMKATEGPWVYLRGVGEALLQSAP